MRVIRIASALVLGLLLMSGMILLLRYVLPSAGTIAYQDMFSRQVRVVQPGRALPATLHRTRDTQSEPVFSPDGRQIAFVDWGPRNRSRLHVRDYPTGGAMILGPWLLSAAHPTWSPDGFEITFMSHLREGGFAIMSANVRTYEIRRLTSTPWGNVSAAYAPDGQTLALVGYGLAGQGRPPGVYLLDTLTGHIENVVELSVLPSQRPAWSPDGTQLAFTVSQTLGPEIYLYDFEAERLRTLESSRSPRWAPSWSPDGTQLVYVSRENGWSNLFVYDMASGATRRLPMPGSVDHPSWGQLGPPIEGAPRPAEYFLDVGSLS